MQATERASGAETDPTMTGHLILDAPTVEVRVETEETWLPGYLLDIFSAGLPGERSEDRSDSRPTFTYRVERDSEDGQDPRWRVVINANRLVTAKSRAELVTGLENVISDRMARSLGEFQLFHSGALIRNGHGILIPGMSGAGKSTTSAALAFAGFEYCSDDIAVFGPDGRLRPFPKVLALKPQGWKVISRYYSKVVESIAYASDVDGVTYVRPPEIPGEKESSKGVPVDLIVMPRRDDPKAATLERIGKSAVVKVLTKESLDLELLGSRAFDALIELVRGAECYSINTLDLDAAVDAVKELTD